MASPGSPWIAAPPSEIWRRPSFRHLTQDLVGWVIALQKRERLSERGLEQLWTPQQLPDGSYRGFNKTTNGYGRGWPGIRRAERPAITPMGGNRAVTFIYPKDDLAVIVLTNLQGASPHSFVDKIAAQYVPGPAVEN